MSGSGETSELLARAVAALQAQNKSWAVEVASRDDNSEISVTTQSEQPIDLGFLVDGEVLGLRILAVSPIRKLDLVGAPAGATVILSVPGTPQNLNLNELVLTSSSATYDVVEIPELLRLVPTDSACVVVIRNGVTVTVDCKNGDALTPELRGGELRLIGSVRTVRLCGSGAISHAIFRDSDRRLLPWQGINTIANLDVTVDSSIIVASDKIHFGTVRGVGEDWELSVDAYVTRSVGRGGFETSIAEGVGALSVENLSRLRIRLGSAKGVRDMRQCRIHAPAVLEFTKAATAEDVYFGRSAEADCRVSVGEASVLTKLAGFPVFALAEHVNISGDREPLTVRLDASANGAGAFDGLVLTKARLPHGLEGRRVLALLANSYHFSPDVAGIPGHDQTLWAWICSKAKRQTRSKYSGSDLVALHEDAEYVRELARLSKEKGAPGSVTTRIAWCAYRLRALKTTGRVERAALRMYRVIGYGERPLPALICWLMLSLLLAGPVLWAGPYNPTFDGGYDQTLLEAGRLALGPLAGLSKSGSLTSSDVAELFARALVSVPLVTGLIALRNYVKGAE